MVTKAQLSKIMRLAWQFIKEQNFTKGEALKTAWLNFRLKAALKIAVVVFAYRKKDGTTRKAIGTLLYPHSEKPQAKAKQVAKYKYTSTLKNRRGGRLTNGIYYAWSFNATM